MKCILEDGANSLLSQFFMRGVHQDKIIFAESNSLIMSRLLELPTDEDVIIFLDMNPWNKQLRSIYMGLNDRLKNKRRRAIIIPIVCAEYNLLIGIKQRSDLIKDTDMYKIILNKELGADCQKYKCKNYEKFCKLVLEEGVVDKVSSSISINPYKKYYTDEDCDIWGMEKRLLEFYRGYRVLTLDTDIVKGSVPITFNQVFEIHKQCVHNYNNWAINVGLKGRSIPEQRYSNVF